ncbi:hypothetical protein LEP1GSC125_3362 [Leptospira mayottensis 200901122]|uniref:Uncharacterized protein n=1 Tax=Leptospira mayottensis 200901122 TaxID=1193010 RepID=A0AA87SVZ3_9LEPT|nr:hypothetical protein LEP1GSC125_3362 [Leptospira mayottensis 200901122]
MAIIEQAIRVKKCSWVNMVLDNSCPPLKPMAKRRYIEKNLDSDSGMTKSDLKKTTPIPRKKNNTGGFNTFSKIACVSIISQLSMI